MKYKGGEKVRKEKGLVVGDSVFPENDRLDSTKFCDKSDKSEEFAHDRQWKIEWGPMKYFERPRPGTPPLHQG